MWPVWTWPYRQEMVEKTSLCERYLSEEENKVAHSVDGGHSERVLHQDDESVVGRGAETGAVDGCRGVRVLKR